ncbi:MAG TPA: thioredoxin domain-containing protein [Candidatus Polarisedimenticolaceae bacterium]|nr:thioredoxin domain-containing protein [Candidatus Polarisedimenticolaceae bacterium]
MRASKVVLAIVLMVAASLPILAKKKKDEAAANTATPAAAAAAASTSAAGSGSAGASDSGEVVARVAGQPITMADLEPLIGARLSQMRTQAEQNEFQLKQQAIDQIVRDRLVEAEAKAKGVTTEALLKTEVDDKAAAPSEDEIKQVYERNKARLGNRTLEESKPEIERQLKIQKSNERRMAYMQELQAKADVQVLLDPPRIKVNVPSNAPARGPEGAPVTLVEFSDYQCPFCKRAHDTVEQLVAAYPKDIRLIFMDYPLPMHNRAAAAAEAARCAGEQGKYWEYGDNLMKTAGDLSDENLKQRAVDLSLDASAFETCISSSKHEPAVQSDFTEGNRVGVSGTPTFFINGRMIVGAKALEDFKQIVDDEIRRAGGKRASN